MCITLRCLEPPSTFHQVSCSKRAIIIANRFYLSNLCKMQTGLRFIAFCSSSDFKRATKEITAALKNKKYVNKTCLLLQKNETKPS